MAGEEREAQVTSLCRNYGLKGRGRRNKKGRMSEVKGTDPEEERREGGDSVEGKDLFFMD